MSRESKNPNWKAKLIFFSYDLMNFSIMNQESLLEITLMSISPFSLPLGTDNIFKKSCTALSPIFWELI